MIETSVTNKSFTHKNMLNFHKAYKLFLISFMAIVSSFYSCQSTDRSDSKADEIIQYLPTEDYLNKYVITLIGTINNIPVTANLVAHDSVINGGYFYNSIGETLCLSGNYDASGKCMISEKNEKGLITGLFEGGFTKEGLFKGTWENPEGSKKFNFVFQVKTAIDEYFGSDSVRIEDCSGKGFDPLDGYSDDCDSCISISLRYDSLNTPNKAINNSVNTELRRRVSFKHLSSLREYPKTKISLNNDRPYTEEASITAVSKSKFGYSFNLFSDYYACGGANPQVAHGFYNFDINSGSFIWLSDLFKPNFEPELVTIFNAQYPNNATDDYWNLNLENISNIEFLLSENGIIFIQRDDLSGEYYEQYFIDYCSLSRLIK